MSIRRSMGTCGATKGIEKGKKYKKDIQYLLWKCLYTVYNTIQNQWAVFLIHRDHRVKGPDGDNDVSRVGLLCHSFHVIIEKRSLRDPVGGNRRARFPIIKKRIINLRFLPIYIKVDRRVSSGLDRFSPVKTKEKKKRGCRHISRKMLTFSFAHQFVTASRELSTQAIAIRIYERGLPLPIHVLFLSM